MIHPKLLDPSNIVIIGASNNIHKPGGKILKNLLDYHFKGEILTVNPKESSVQGIKCYKDVADLPLIDLAILAIPSLACPDIIKTLAFKKQTRGFIIISANFGEAGAEGKAMEEDIVHTINCVNGTLIGPNCIGLLNHNLAGIFSSPVPPLDPFGLDFASESGATAVFIIESGISKGLHFSSVFSVGNSPQTGIEEILEYWDESYKKGISSPTKILYLEKIKNPTKLLKHAQSLIIKGCKIAAIKAGVSNAGSRAAASHTGALMCPDVAVNALFQKAGIIRCYSRDELTSVAGILSSKPLFGKNIAIITHAGGPAVMLSDTLEKGGFFIPSINDSGEKKLLKESLSPGSSVENPFDILATGTAGQLATVIDFCEQDDSINGIVVIFGSPGLSPVYEAYHILNEKIKSCQKPIYTIIPSVINAKNELSEFIASGNIAFPDEVLFGKALSKTILSYKTDISSKTSISLKIDTAEIRRIIDNAKTGFLASEAVHNLLNAANIPCVNELFVHSEEEALSAANQIGFPLVMKVIGPIHKTEVNGVALNITDLKSVKKEFIRLMQIEAAHGVLLSPMLKGLELFIGAKKESEFGHLILCGLGGINLEVLKDTATALTPLSSEEALLMIRSLKSYPLINGYRNQVGIDEYAFAEILAQVSIFLQTAPEIKEMDINPLIGINEQITAVDARIFITK